jgi:hypothetical protein
VTASNQSADLAKAPSPTVISTRKPLKDLSLPPEALKEADDYCRRYKYRRVEERRRVEEDFKLQIYYGGQDVALLETPEGLVVVMAGDLGSAEFGRVLEALSSEERRQVSLYSPMPWNNEDENGLPLSYIS